VPTDLLQVLLRLQDVRASLLAAGEGHPGARAALGEVPTAAESAAGVAVWTHALQRGNLPTELSFQDAGPHATFPCQPLRGLLLATLAHLQVASFADRYPSLRCALLNAVAEAAVSYATLRRDTVLPAMARAVVSEEDRDEAHADELAVTQTDAYKLWAAKRAAAVAAKKAEAQAQAQAAGGGDGVSAAGAATLAHTLQQPADWAGDPASWEAARQVCAALHKSWAPAAAALRRAGVAFTGLDEALGGTRGGFALDDPSWSRPGWDLLAKYSHTLAECKELRDLVRRLGRGAGWGPLRLSPTQRWDDHGRDGLLRDPLEAAETRSLTRGGDVAMMLPAEASLYAKGRTLRAARLLFYARAAERALLSYARDGWAVLPAADIAPWIREVRPTAERGPILLCLDSSGSMRGAREAVAKALALECMRAARVQERRCFCFAFSGPALVEELELGSDPQGLSRLLDFMERSFNGGSDLNTPLGACIRRLATAEWANSDILVVSDGELRQPSAEVTRSISAAKADLGLRIHGLQLPVRPKHGWGGGRVSSQS
jgi:Mg-chelatase subunit ChlD